MRFVGWNVSGPRACTAENHRERRGVISHEHRLIFIHIPKCAGTSVERRFGHFDGFSGRNGQDHRPVRMIRSPLVNGGEKVGHGAAQNQASGGVPSAMARALAT